jgi:hypothetical protein
MEEMSFRSGAAVSAGALAVVGASIALAVALSGHSDAAASPAGAGGGARSVAASSAPASPGSPAARPAAPTTARPSVTWTSPAQEAEGYQAPARRGTATSPQASPLPSADLPQPHRTPPPGPPSKRPVPGQPPVFGQPG